MASIAISLQLNETADMPAASIIVQIDGQAPISQPVTLETWLTVLDAAGQAVEQDLRATMRPVITRATETLRRRIANEDVAQQARQAALQEWAPIADDQ